MLEHRYQQYCALACALDLAGDRWTLLIVRELVPGPRRFTDLVDGLPGISRKLLTERLRALEGEGIVATQAIQDASSAESEKPPPMSAISRSTSCEDIVEPTIATAITPIVIATGSCGWAATAGAALAPGAW